MTDCVNTKNNHAHGMHSNCPGLTQDEANMREELAKLRAAHERSLTSLTWYVNGTMTPTTYSAKISPEVLRDLLYLLIMNDQNTDDYEADVRVPTIMPRRIT